MDNEKGSYSAKDELIQAIEKLTPHQQELLLKSWEYTMELNKDPDHHSVLGVFLQ